MKHICPKDIKKQMKPFFVVYSHIWIFSFNNFCFQLCSVAAGRFPHTHTETREIAGWTHTFVCFLVIALWMAITLSNADDFKVQFCFVLVSLHCRGRRKHRANWSTWKYFPLTKVSKLRHQREQEEGFFKPSNSLFALAWSRRCWKSTYFFNLPNSWD